MEEKNNWERELEKLKEETGKNDYWKLQVKKSEESIKSVLLYQIKIIIESIIDASEKFEVFFTDADYKVFEIGRLNGNYIKISDFFEDVENGRVTIIESFEFYVKYTYSTKPEKIKIIESDRLAFYFSPFQFSLITNNATYSKFYDEIFAIEEVEKIVNNFAVNLLEKVNLFLKEKD